MKFTIALVALLPIALAAPAVSNLRDTDATTTVDVLASIEPTDLDVLKARDGDFAPIGDIIVTVDPELEVLKSRDGPVEVLGDNVVGDISKSIGAKLDVPPVKRELSLQEALAEAIKKRDEARRQMKLKEANRLNNEVIRLKQKLASGN